MNKEIVQEDMDKLFLRKEVPIEMLKGKKILITGANGMLATYLIFFLCYLNKKKKYGIEIFALTRNKEKAIERFSGIIQINDVIWLFQDVCDKLNIEDNQQIDYIVHAAGDASPASILKDPISIIKTNTLGTMNILDFARTHNCIRTLFLSTREVYGEVSNEIRVVSENCFGKLDSTDLRSCYPESKRMAETILESYKYRWGIDYVTVRIAHSYGPGMSIENDGRVMADFISDIVHYRDIVLKSDGSAERAFCYITDTIAGMLIAMLKGESGKAYNLANESEPLLIREVAEILVQLFCERDCSIVYKIPQKMSRGYVKFERKKLDTSKLEQLGWKCEINLKNGLKRTVLSFE